MKDSRHWQAQRAENARKYAMQKAERERKQAMIPYVAEIVFEVRADSRMEVRRAVSEALYPRVERAALESGDLLAMSQKQQNGFSGRAESADRPGYFRFTGTVLFVSDSLVWEQASAWLRELLDGFHHEDIRVLALKRYEGFFSGGF